jgi:hypothetical protein
VPEGACVKLNRAATLALAALLALPDAGAASPHADVIGQYLLTEDLAYFGGFSGLEFSTDGQQFTALSDSAAIVTGRVARTAAGAITAVTFAGPPIRLLDADGAVLAEPYDDSEGLAMGQDGALYISFELANRVVRYRPDGKTPVTLPIPAAFEAFEYNAGPEALAIAADGTLYTMPEGLAVGVQSVPVFRFQDTDWDQPFSLPEDGTWRPVGADIGPDNRLYVLERDFWPLLGFRSRLRRFDLGAAPAPSAEELFVSSAGQLGNLEGISIWQDPKGTIHATLISDNNFLAIQDSGFVDLVISD